MRRFVFPVLTLILLVMSLPLFAQEEVTPPDATAEESTEATTELPPEPVNSQTVNGVTLDLYFGSLAQGEAGIIHVTGTTLQDVRGRFINRDIKFYTVEGLDGFYALVAAGMEQNPRTYDLTVVAQTETGSETLTTQVEVGRGAFIRQNLDIPPDRAYLIDPEVERNEFARLNAVFNQTADEKLWGEAGFRLPVNSEFTSPFGSFRTFNSTVETRHTGWDLRAATGTPVVATADGVVGYAGMLDIRGNHVIIDHGLGIHSGYSHMSQIHVTRGQTVTAGQIIGVSGNTGRSGGAHLHWEISFNGEWLDAAQFYELWIP